MPATVVSQCQTVIHSWLRGSPQIRPAIIDSWKQINAGGWEPTALASCHTRKQGAGANEQCKHIELKQSR